MKKIFIFINYFFLLPHLVVFYLHPEKKLILKDVLKWGGIFKIDKSLPFIFFHLMINHKEFRTLFYYRLKSGFLIRVLNLVFPRLDSLYLCTPQIGGGFFIVHGFSTIVNAQLIGDDCIIYQNVTVGLNERSDKGPIIGKNVRICASAMILGNIRIGDNSIIGAGALVLKDVPDNCTVVGNPAYIINRNGIKENTKL